MKGTITKRILKDGKSHSWVLKYDAAPCPKTGQRRQRYKVLNGSKIKTKKEEEPEKEKEKEIVSRITKVEKILRIILFGSQAYGNQDKNSDIDLLVVIDKNVYPKNFKEKSENFLKISRAIRPIEKEVPIDLVVYTKPEFERFVELDSMFSRKVLRQGKELS